MNYHKAIMKAGYVVLFALLALVFYLVYDSTHHENSEVLHLFSDRGVSAVRIVCISLAVCAGALALFFVLRAFYFGFTRPKLREKDDHVA